MSNVVEFNGIIPIAVVGDGAIGKTSFLISFACNSFPEEYVPTVFDNYETTHTVKNVRYMLELVDTGLFIPFKGLNSTFFIFQKAGQEDYDEIRQMIYEDMKLIIVCYSVDNPRSLENVRLKWVPEVENQTGSPEFPKILLGLKGDLESKVDPEKVKKMREENGFAYREDNLVCSSKTGQGLVKVFDFAIESFVRHLNGEKIFRPKYLLDDVSEENKEENERIESYFSNVSNFIISTPRKEIRTSRFFLIESSIPKLQDVDTYALNSDFDVDEKIVLNFFLCQEEELKKLKNEELFEYFYFFCSLRTHNQLFLILELLRDGDRTSNFFDTYRLFQTYCLKCEKNEVLKSWFIPTSSESKNNMISIQPSTFDSSIGLFLFNRLKDNVHEVQTNPEILQTFEKTIFSVIPVLSSFSKINHFLHMDFHDFKDTDGKGMDVTDLERIDFFKVNLLMRRLRYLKDNDDDEDLRWTSNLILVSTDGVEFPCHREMLVLRLGYFKRMFEFPGEEKKAIETEKRPRIKIVDMDSKLISMILDFVYLGEVREDESVEDLIKMIVNAQKYVASDLTNHCLERISKKGKVFKEREELGKMISSISHLLYENDQVNELVIPRLASKCCSFRIREDEVVDMIRISQKEKRMETKMQDLDRLEEMEDKVERQRLEIEELKRKNEKLEEEAMRMKKFLEEKFGFK